MAELIVMVGLPGSGKTTWAKREQAEAKGHIVIVSRDDLREKLFNGAGILERSQEDFITKVEDRTVILALEAGFDVIVDSMNLRPEYVKRWRNVANLARVRMKLIKMTATVELCIARDKARGERGGRSVGEGMIRRLASRSA